MSINSFATSVSDNDGSAFITKAEFDALKSSFQAQIDTYNLGIDNKIDNAIASYLAGITISKDPENILDRVNSAVGGTLWFKNKFENLGSSTIKTDFKLNFIRHYTYNAINNLVWTGEVHLQAVDGTSGYWTKCNFGTNLFAKQVTPDCSTRIWYAELQYPGTKAFAENNYVYGDTGAASYQNNHAGWKDVRTTGHTNITSSKVVTDAGAGSAWIYEQKPSGRKILKSYATTVYPRQVIDIVAHTYKDFDTEDWTKVRDWYGKDNGLADEQTLTAIAIPQIYGWGQDDDGTKVITDSTDTLKQYWKINQYMSKATDGINYDVYMWGAGANASIYCQDVLIQPVVAGTATTKNASDTATTFQAPVYASNVMKNGDNKLSGQKYSYYEIGINNTSMVASNNFCNEYISGIVGEDVKIDAGIPILKTTSDEQELTLTLKFKCQGANPSSKVYYKISDKRFTNNTWSSGAEHLAEGNVTAGTSINVTFTKVSKGDIWLTCYADTATITDAAIDTMTYTFK